MVIRFRKTREKIGLAPGTLVYTGAHQKDPVHIEVIDYTKDKFEKKRLKKVAELQSFKKSKSVTWINITGIHDTKMVEDVCTLFDIHPLVMEDIVNVNQRPKLEMYDSYFFIVFKMIHEKRHHLAEFEQVSLVLKKNIVITFQEDAEDIFNPVRERIENSKWRIRSRKSDYLTYALIDTVVDHYFAIMEHLGQRVEDIESQVLHNQNDHTLGEIYKLKRELVAMRRAIWPLREVISQLHKSESKVIEQGTKFFIRDLYDHMVQVMDTVDNFREMGSGLLDTYLTNVSNKMNEVMKVLTIIATIFIPLTFIAGIYGMNFQRMPELAWQWGYFAVLGIMGVVAIAMIIFFRRKKWI